MTPTDAAIVEAALARRRELIDSGRTTAYRLLHTDADGVAGVVIERFGPALIVQLHEGRLTWPLDRVRRLAEAFQAACGTAAVYLKRFVRDRAAASAATDARHRDPSPWIGTATPPEFAVEEHGAKYLIRPYDGFSVGLFLEHRDNRLLVREMAAGRRVLNLFAYTCGFSVAAALGGAAHVASVDLSKRYLEWGRRNFAANGLDHLTGGAGRARGAGGAGVPPAEDPVVGGAGVPPARIEQPVGPAPKRHADPAAKFYASDLYDFYRRAVRQRLSFDLVVLDPPTFSRTRRPARVFELTADLPRLLAGAISLLAPGGRLLFATNNRQLPPARVEAELRAAAGGLPRRFHIESRPNLPVDFAADRDYSKALLARVD